MKNLLKIKLFLFTSSSKKLIFVFIVLLILPFSGCKSVVKETDVEKPVRIVSPNGEVYVGETVSGKPHGQGTRTYPGNKYVGEWKDGRWDGQGTYTWSNGDKYVGGWKDGKEHGQGTSTYGKGKWEGDKYVGEWKDGKHHGKGPCECQGNRIFCKCHGKSHTYFHGGFHGENPCQIIAKTKMLS